MVRATRSISGAAVTAAQHAMVLARAGGQLAILGLMACSRSARFTISAISSITTGFW
jgi:hypothetical protein